LWPYTRPRDGENERHLFQEKRKGLPSHLHDNNNHNFPKFASSGLYLDLPFPLPLHLPHLDLHSASLKHKGYESLHVLSNQYCGHCGGCSLGRHGRVVAWLLFWAASLRRSVYSVNKVKINKTRNAKVVKRVGVRYLTPSAAATSPIIFLHLFSSNAGEISERIFASWMLTVHIKPSPFTTVYCV
jgi:hypothetical protein